MATQNLDLPAHPLERRLDRRTFLRAVVGTAGLAAAGSLLAACGGAATSAAPTSPPAVAATSVPAAAAPPTADAAAANAAAAQTVVAMDAAAADAAVAAAPTAAPAAAATAAPAAAATTAPAASTLTGQLEMFSWWTTGGEEAGLKAMYAIYNQRNPGVEIVNQAVAGGSGAGGNAKAVLKNRMLGGDPPDAFQVHMGKELTDGYVAADQVEPLDELFAAEGYETAFPKGVLDIIRADDHYWSVPVNIHRSNVLWYNKKVLSDNGLQPPVTFDDFFAASEKLKGAGITPLAMGDKNPFASAHVFENILLGVLGPEEYIKIWTAESDWNSAKVTESLEIFKKMLAYVNTDHAALDWNQSNDYVIQGTAAFMIMGDWTNGDYTAKKFDGYGWTQSPGTAGVFNALSDTFALPKGAKNRDNSIEWLKLSGSIEGQDAFNPLKGSIPANINAGKAAGYNEYLQSTMKDWAAHTIVPSPVHGAAIKDGWAQAFVENINTFVANQDVAATQKAMASACVDANVCA